MNSPFSDFSKSECFLDVLKQGYEALANPENVSLENIVRFVIGKVGITSYSVEFMNDLLECVIDDCIALGYSDSLILDFKMLRHQYQVSRPRLLSSKRFCHFLMKIGENGIQRNLFDGPEKIIFSDQDLLRDAFYGGNWKYFAIAIMHDVSLDFSDEMAHYKSCRRLSEKLNTTNISILICQQQKITRSLGFSKKRRKLIGVCVRMFTEIFLNPQLSNQCVKCLRLLYEYIEEPKVNCEEIKQFQALFSCLGVDEECVNIFGEICIHYMPECALPYSPRCLKHLARCKLRKYLKAAGRHPDDIPETLISKRLVQYLKLDLYNLLG